MDLFGSPLTVSLDPGAMQALRDIQYAVANAGKATKEAGEDAQESAEGGWTELKSKIELVTGAISTAIETITGAASAIATLTAEQQRLDGQSARLNLDFDQAAAAAGRFADETDAMRVATTAAESGLRMTQTELDAFMRRAGQYSQATGQDMTASTQRLTEALMAGSQEGLNRFGGELARAAEGGSTLGERLQALVTDANDVEAATDDAATAMERAQDSFDDMKRAAAAAFAEQISAAGLLNRALGQTEQGADDASDKLRALGRLGADTVQLIGGTIGTVLGGIAYVASTAYSAAAGLYDAIEARVQGRGTEGARAAFQARWREGQEMRDAIESFTIRSSSAVEDVTSGRTQDEARDRDAAAGQARRDQETADRIGAETLASAGFNADGTPRRGGARGRRAGGASGGGRGRSALDRALEENAPLKAEAQRLVDESADIQAMFAAQRAAEEAKSAAQRAVDEAVRIWEQGTPEQQAANDDGKSAAQRAVDEAAQRVASERSLTGQLRAQFEERTSAAQMMAEGVRGAYDAMTDAAGRHLAALAQGRETAAEAGMGILHDFLARTSEEYTIKALAATGEGIFAAARYDWGAAVQYAGAAAVFGTVAALTGAGAAATAPKPTAGAAASGDQRAAPTRDRARSGDASGQGTVVNVNVSGFVVGSAGEVARQLTNVLRLGYDQAGVTIPQRALA